jgi:hypothetical protein
MVNGLQGGEEGCSHTCVLFQKLLCMISRAKKAGNSFVVGILHTSPSTCTKNLAHFRFPFSPLPSQNPVEISSFRYFRAIRGF